MAIDHLVSIIMSSYNHAPYVAESIASAAAQTHPRLEMIVVDDGSQDDSAAVIEAAIDRHRDRFERCVFERRSHRGGSRSLNRCLELARGEYVSVLDSDDVFLRNKISTLLAAEAWESPEVAAVFGNAAFIDENSCPVAVDVDLSVDPTGRAGFNSELDLYLAVLGFDRHDPAFATYANLIRANFIPDGAAMIRRSSLLDVRSFDARLVAGDYGLWLKFARSHRLAFVDTVVAYKRWHGGNVSIRRRDRMWRDVGVLLARERSHCRELGLRAEWRAAFERAVYAILTYGRRRDLVALFWERSRVAIARELHSIVRASRRQRRTKIRPWRADAWSAEVGLDDWYRLYAHDFLSRPKPTLRARAWNRVRYGRLGRFVSAAPGIPGWTQPREAIALARASRDLPPDAVIVELGSFLGRSSVLIGGGCHAARSGRLHCVDVFDASGDAFSVPFYRAIAASLTCSLRTYFDAAIDRTGLRGVVTVHQGTSEAIARAWTQPIGMLFMDGDQTPEGTRRDFEAWSRHLKPGGLLALHSTTATEEGHDGPARLASEVVRPPEWSDVHRVDTTVFARKSS